MARAIIGQCLIVALGDGETEVSHVGIEAVDLNKLKQCLLAKTFNIVH